MTRKTTSILGIDIGGSGIKGALVDPTKGVLTTERHRISTPQPATPDAIAEVIAAMVQHFDYQGTVGCTFPAVVRHGVVHTAANVDKSWIGTDADKLFEKATACPVHMLNDADAAGVAEVVFGAAKGQSGLVLMLTFGTGIGSAMFLNGELIPNTELGHLELNGKPDVEVWASAKAREEKDLSWKRWGKRVNAYLQHLESLLSPDLFVIGGGISKKSEKFFPYLQTETPIVAAQLLNEAGIVGAAYIAQKIKT